MTFPVVVFDLETNGLFNFKLPADDPSQPRVASIAAALLADADAEPVIMDRLIKPDGWTMPAELVEKLGNGLHQERLEAEGIPIADALDEFLALLDRAEVLASYGILFDTKGLRSELRRAGRPDLFGTKAEFCVMREATKQCKLAPTAAMAASGRNWSKTAKLSEACEILLGRPHEGAHSALADTMTTVDLYRMFAAKGCVVPKVRESFVKQAAPAAGSAEERNPQ
jgi:DNA polymerase-3 subunit epsilon